MGQDNYQGSCSICVGALREHTIIEVAGEVDIATVSLLAKALGDSVRSGRSHVILDAQKLAYIDSAGLQTLISTQQKLTSKNRRMVIVGCHGIFDRLLKIAQLDHWFTMYSSVDEALADLQK